MKFKTKGKQLFQNDGHLSLTRGGIWILFSIILLLALPAMAQSENGISESPLIKIRIESDRIGELLPEFKEQGYDILYNTETDTSIDLIVSEEELSVLEQKGHLITEKTPGRPFEEISWERGEDVRGPAGYPDIDKILEKMNETAKKFPNIAKVFDITEKYRTPKTYEGRHLYAMKISDNVDQEEDEQSVLIVSLHHAREIVTPVIALNAISQLTENYSSNNEIKKMVDTYEIWIAPVWNPDGYNHVFVKDNNWRKNRHVFPKGTGVDQNRNYPFLWNAKCSGDLNPASNEFKGETAGSEAETQTMVQWSIDQRFSKVVDFHSAGREAVYGYMCSPHPSTAWKNWMAADAGTLAQKSGYGNKKRAPSADGEHYQFQMGQMGAWAFLVETATEFQPAYSAAEAEAKKVWPGIQYAINRPVNIWGHVTDAKSGAPIEAVIELPDVPFKNKESNSSEPRFGRYHIFAPKGDYSIRVSAKGYVTKTEKISLAANDSSEKLDIQLEPENGGGPTPPKGLTAKPGKTFISLDWQDNPESTVSQYNVKRATAENGPFTTIKTVSKSEYTDNDVTKGTTYHYAVTALDADKKESGLSNKVSATPDESGPPSSNIASDDFESKGWSGGTGWTGPWKKTGDVKKLTAKPYKGKKYARLRANTGRLEREVNLSRATNPVLRFASRIRSFEQGDRAVVKISSDGKTYSDLTAFTAQEMSDTYKIYELPLSSFSKSAQFKVVFEAQMNGKKDYWYIDEVEIIDSK